MIALKRILFGFVLSLSLLFTSYNSVLAALGKSQASTNSHATVIQSNAQNSSSNKKHPSRLWNLRNVDIRSVIAEVSRETGKNFIIDQRVQGKISIIATTPMSSDEVYPVFLAALQISGYAAVPSGKVIKIIPSVDSNTLSTPIANSANPGVGDEMVVRVINVRYVSAQQLVPLLRPLMPQWGQIAAYPPSNTIIISGRASILNRLVQIINSVDSADSSSINLVPLKYASAQDVVAAIKSLQSGQVGGPQMSVAADDRNNAVMISGNPETRLRLRLLISELDGPTRKNDNRDTQIIPLQFMQVKDMLPILAGVAKSHYNGPVETVMGTRTLVNLESSDTGTGGTTPGIGVTGTGSVTGTSTTGSTGAAASSNPSSNTSDFSASVSGSTQGGTSKESPLTKPVVEIIGEPNTNSIIINAPPDVLKELKTIIDGIDIRPTQVAIEAIIANLDENNSDNLGIDWGAVTAGPAGTRQGQPSGSGSGSIFTPGFGIIPTNQVQHFEAQFYALAQNGQSDVLSTPSVVVLDNHLAHIQVGTQVSLDQTTYPNNAGGTTGATPYTTKQRANAALDLKVTPQVGRNGTIKLNIIQENNTVVPSLDPIKIANPDFNISQIGTSVIINSGDILVFGGLIQNSLTNNDQSIPILGDIPVLGKLFHHVNRTTQKKKLMVFLHARILHSAGDSSEFSTLIYDKVRRLQLKSLLTYPYEDSKGTVMPARNNLNLPIPFSNQVALLAYNNKPKNYSK